MGKIKQYCEGWAKMKRMYMFFVALALVILAFSPAEAQRKNTTKHDVAPINMSTEKQKLSEQENMHKFDKKECNCKEIKKCCKHCKKEKKKHHKKD